MKKIAFIDLEASGLGATSWPIEVGWCFLDGAPETFLIARDENWPDEAWDAQAEALHGISRDSLNKQGQPIDRVCARLNEALSDGDVFSDAPDWDAFWLYRLFSASSHKQSFSLKDFGDLLRNFSPEKVNSAIKRASATTPHRHRAHEDVLHMQAIYKLAAA